MRRLSDTTEEVIFGKTKDVLEELECIAREAREGTPASETKASILILHTRQVALLTMASLKISKSLDAILRVVGRRT